MGNPGEASWRAALRMDLFLALFLSAAASPPRPQIVARAEARVIILRPHKASAESWAPETRRDQREIVKKEKDGTRIRLRLTEFE